MSAVKQEVVTVVSQRPWKFVPGKKHDQDGVRSSDGHHVICFGGPNSGYPDLDEQDRVNGKHLVECVNACADFENPRALRDLLILAKHVKYILEGEGGQVGCIRGQLNASDFENVFKKLGVA